MKTKVQKWGNSLGVRFPKLYAKETGIFNGSRVDISIENGKLIIEPVHDEDLSLNELLSKISAENLHGEIESDSIGKEIW